MHARVLVSLSVLATVAALHPVVIVPGDGGSQVRTQIENWTSP